jgi:hypothetical protein
MHHYRWAVLSHLQEEEEQEDEIVLCSFSDISRLPADDAFTGAPDPGLNSA